jgi:hypothetical protein
MFKRLVSLFALLAAAVLITTAVDLPTLNVGPESGSETVGVQAKDPELICPGPVFVNGGETGLKLGNFTQSGSASLLGRDGSNQIELSLTGIKTIAGTQAGTKNFNAVQWQNPRGSQASGLAVANCVPGLNEGLLVAGDNSVGREALLVLVNPTPVDATVSLELFGSNGIIQGTGLSGISAPAGKATVLPLAAFAPKAETFAVKVSSRGAAIGMWLQQKTIRGVTPGGLDYIGVSPAASETVEIPGLFLRSAEKLSTLIGQDSNFTDTKPMLRIFTPGDQESTFTAQVQGADGASFGTVIQGTVPAGSVRDFVLEDLADGNYSIHIDSDLPIHASVRFNRIGGGQPDIAWAVQVAPSIQDGGFTTVNGAISKLSIVNPGDATAKVTLGGKTFKISAQSNTVIDLLPGTTYRIQSDVAVAVSQVIDISSAVAVIPVLDFQAAGGTINLSLR